MTPPILLPSLATVGLAIATWACKPKYDSAQPVDSLKPGLHLYVSPMGNDASDGGTETNAFLTVTRARDEIRLLKSGGPLPTGGVAVNLLSGLYPLKDSLEFTAEDSGTADAPIIYQAAEKRSAVLSGSRILKLAEFAPVTDTALLKRLDPAAKEKVLVASIDGLGLKHAGPFSEAFDDSGGVFELFWILRLKRREGPS